MTIQEPEVLYEKCGRCNKTTRMDMLNKYHHISEDEVDNHTYIEEVDFYITSCPACNGVNFILDYYGELSVLWPVQPKELVGLPSKVSKEYQAALAVKKISSNAYAVLLGRVLDLVCIEKGAKGDTLVQRLKDLSNNGVIPGNLADMAHQLRQLRNIGAHADLGELTSSEVPILDALCIAVLEYVYTAPNLIKQVERRIAELKADKNKPIPS